MQKKGTAGIVGAAHLVRPAKPLDSEGSKMSRPNGEADGVTSAIGPKTHENQQVHFAVDAGEDKPFATLQAQLALKGYSLSRTHVADGPVRFYVTRWGLVRELRDFAAVREFAEQVGVQL